MDPNELMTALAACRSDWRRSDDADLPYLQIAAMGHDLHRAIRNGCRERWVHDVFRVIETALTTGDPLAQNLVVVGMFEAMQGDAWRDVARPDRLDDWLLPASLVAWRDLIEGWIGPGIRSVEHWRRVIVNGPVDAVRWATSPSRRDEVRIGGELHWESGWRTLSTGERDRVFAAFRPLVARALVPPGVLDAPDVLMAFQGERVRRIELSGDLGTDGDRWFTLDVTALRAVWPSRVPDQGS